jgi:hypothetical protein
MKTAGSKGAVSVRNPFAVLEGAAEEVAQDRGRERSDNGGAASSGNPGPRKAAHTTPGTATSLLARGSVAEGGMAEVMAEVVGLRSMVRVLTAKLESWEARQQSSAGTSTSGRSEAPSGEAVERLDRAMRRSNLVIHGIKWESGQSISGLALWGQVTRCLRKAEEDLPPGWPRDGQPWANMRVVHRSGDKVVVVLQGLTVVQRYFMFKLKKVLKEQLGWGIDDDLTPLQRQQRRLRGGRMAELFKLGVRPAWRGSEVVWLDTKSDKWVVEVFGLPKP